MIQVRILAELICVTHCFLQYSLKVYFCGENLHSWTVSKNWSVVISSCLASLCFHCSYSTILSFQQWTINLPETEKTGVDWISFSCSKMFWPQGEAVPYFRVMFKRPWKKQIRSFCSFMLTYVPNYFKILWTCQQHFIPKLCMELLVFFSIGRKMNITHKIGGTDGSLLKTNVEGACCIPISFSNMESTKCELSMRFLVQDWLQMGSNKKVAPKMVLKSPHHNVGHDVLSTF